MKIEKKEEVFLETENLKYVISRLCRNNFGEFPQAQDTVENNVRFQNTTNVATFGQELLDMLHAVRMCSITQCFYSKSECFTVLIKEGCVQHIM